jgi:ubiquinone/menaquinone biosynthesis C-methylase UbiE
MALLFPDTHIVGVDFKEATLSNLQHDLPNLEFRHTVIHDSFTGLESFASSSVDYIMMRDAWLINTPVSKWKNVLRESLRILKPGGWIELTEHSKLLIITLFTCSC